MHNNDVIYYVVVPLVLFFLGALGTGVAGLIKITSHLVRSQTAQEATAISTKEIAEALKDYMKSTDGRFRDVSEEIHEHDQRLSSHEFRLNEQDGRIRSQDTRLIAVENLVRGNHE